MSEHLVKYLTAIVEEGSFSRAAEALEISQPSLSQFVRRLEAERGAVLIDRKARPMKLTPAGEAVLETETKIMKMRESCAKIVDELNRGDRGRLVIGASHYRSIYFLTSILPTFIRTHPGIEVQIVEATTKELEQFAVEGRCDLCVMPTSLHNEALETVNVYYERYLVVVDAGNPVIQKVPASTETYPPIDFSLFDGAPFITVRRGQRLRAVFEKVCLECHVFPRVVLETVSPVAALLMASEGLGAAIVTETMAKHAYPRHPVRYFSLTPEQPLSPVGAVYRKDLYLSRAAREFIETMRELARSFNTPAENRR